MKKLKHLFLLSLVGSFISVGAFSKEHNFTPIADNLENGVFYIEPYDKRDLVTNYVTYSIWCVGEDVSISTRKDLHLVPEKLRSDYDFEISVDNMRSLDLNCSHARLIIKNGATIGHYLKTNSSHLPLKQVKKL